MKNAITTKPQAKTIVSALRRELKALDKGTAALSHNDCLTVMAKALGFPSWNAWEATLAEDVSSAPPAASVVGGSRPKYPLVNHGQFDFVEEGEDGAPFDGATLRVLQGTSDIVLATALVNTVRRPTNDNPTDDGSLVHLEHAGDSEVHWDTQEVQQQNNVSLWVNEDGEDVSEARLVIGPEGFDRLYDEEDLPVREKLVDAFVEYYASAGLDADVQQGNFVRAEKIIGFGLTLAEEAALSERLLEAKGKV